MLAYNDIGTYTFVFVYDCETLRSSSKSLDAGAILAEMGLRPADSAQELQLNLSEFAATEHFENPQLLEFDGGEAFLECKVLEGLERPAAEMQLGSLDRSGESLFDSSRYTSAVRDRLVTCVDNLIALDGFEFGFSLHLGDDENEVEYRDWFAECIDQSRFSLARLVNHDWLSIHSLAAGGKTLQRYGREAFERCPAWRISHPSDTSVNVFFNSVSPIRGYSMDPGQVTYEREAFAHLRATLLD